MTTGIVANVRRLMVGNGLAQALQFLSILVLSRIYLPEDFGLLGQVQSVATAAAIVATLQLHLVIPLAVDAGQAREVARTTQTLCLLLAAVALPLASLLGFVPVAAVLLAALIGISNTFVSVLVYRGNFRKLSGFYVARATFLLISQVTLALLSVGHGLVWAAIVGEGFAALYLRVLLAGGGIAGLAGISLVAGVVRTWKSFSLYGTIQELASVAAFLSPLLWFANRFGDATGGQYAMASRLVWAPVVLVSGSLAQVLYHRYAQQPAEGSRWPGLGWPDSRLLIGAAAVCGTAFLLQEVFLKLLGQDWVLASQLIPLHVLWGCFFLFSIPSRVACRVMRLQRYQCAVDLMMLVLIAALFALPGMTPLEVMWALVALAAVQNGLLCLVAQVQLKRDRQ